MSSLTGRLVEEETSAEERMQDIEFVVMAAVFYDSVTNTEWKVSFMKN